jgi:hypothetical protein
MECAVYTQCWWWWGQHAVYRMHVPKHSSTQMVLQPHCCSALLCKCSPANRALKHLKHRHASEDLHCSTMSKQKHWLTTIHSHPALPTRICWHPPALLTVANNTTMSSIYTCRVSTEAAAGDAPQQYHCCCCCCCCCCCICCCCCCCICCCCC